MNKLFVFIVIFIAFISSCKENSKYDIDISNVELEVKTKHFEKDLSNFNVEKPNYYINNYRKEYGEFFKLFNFQIVEMGSSEDIHYPENLDLFVRYWKDKGVFDVIEKEFSNFDKEQLPEIEAALKHYRYYFPKNNIPDIYTYFSSFGYSVVTLDSVVGIGLDKYLGYKNFNLYDKVGFSMYQKRRMIKEMIPVDLMESIAKSDYPSNEDSLNTLLDNMIYEGKIQYYLNCMLPKTEDTLKWKYTDKQLNWANKFENKVWNYIAEKRILYSTDQNEIRKFIGEGPYTSIFTDSSAPRAGAYIGFKIVENYMNRNPKISLKDLMGTHNAREILTASKYNP